MSVYGTLILEDDIEQTIVDRLKEYLEPAYLRELDRLTGRDLGQLPAVKSWGLGDVEDRLGEQNVTPALFVETAEADMIGTSTAFTAVTPVSIAMVCRSPKSMRHARSLAQLYRDAAAAILLQRGVPGWGRFDYASRRTGVLSAETRRYLARSEANLVVEIPNVIQRDIGPVIPEAEPDEYPTAETVVTSVTTD